MAWPDGSVRRVTRGARLNYPSVSSDGAHAVAVQQEAGDTWLVSVDLGTGAIEPLTERVDDVLWAYPRTSPDGRLVAASRWEPGAYYDLVILDERGDTLSAVTRDRAVDLAPAWSPDGRWLLWSSDRTGIPNIFAVDVAPDGRPGTVRQVTNAVTGFSNPEVSPDGRWLYLSAYHADGWHLERIPFDPSSWFEPAPADSQFLTGGSRARSSFPNAVDSPEEPYRALSSVLPRYWEPTFRQGEYVFDQRVLGPSIGLRTAGIDLVGRHALGLTLRYEPQGSRWSGRAAYSFAGLGNPLLGLSFDQGYSSSGDVVVDETGGEPVERAVFVVERERELRGSVTFERRRVQQQLSVTLGASYVWESNELLNSDLQPEEVFSLVRPTAGLPQLSATVGFNTARIHPFSIRREDGVRGFVRGRRRLDATVADTLAGELGWDRSFTDLTGELRLYQGIDLWGFANHVLTFRASGGAAGDTGADRFHFTIGGISGQGERITGLELISGSNLLFPVRGYERGIRSGRYAWTATAEYRFPIARINRGAGDFPLYLDWIAGTAFLDAGNAWGPELGEGRFENPRRDAVASAGGELLFEGLPIWTVSTLLRTGVAVPLTEGSGADFYLRIGLSF
jgi:hypothetical protein